VNEYIPYPALGSTNSWEAEWFYLRNPYPPLPKVKNKAPEYVLEWIGPGPESNNGQVKDLMKLVACMREMRVTTTSVVYNWIQRKIRPLQKKSTFGFEY